MFVRGTLFECFFMDWNVQNDEKLDDRDAHDELDRMMNAEKEKPGCP